MRVGVFFTGGASAFKSMQQDPNYSQLYDVVVGVTNKKDASGCEAFNEDDIPVIFNPLDFPAFDVESAIPMYESLLKELEQYNLDLIALSGFMRLLTYPIIERGEEKGVFSDRVYNVHPAPLTILTGPRVERMFVGDIDAEEVAKLVKANELERRFRGEDAVYDAAASGELRTQSTIHIATEVFDEGPIVVGSKFFDIPEKVRKWASQKNGRPVRRFSDNLQDEMKLHGDGPAFCKALEMTALGELAIDGKTLYRNGDKMPYGGYQMVE